MTLRKALLMATVLLLSAPVVPALAHDDEDNGYNSHDQFHDQLSGAHERAHEDGFYIVVSTVPIIAPFGTFMARLTDINQRRNTIIQGLVIMAMAIEVIDSVSDWGSFASQSREPLQSCAAA